MSRRRRRSRRSPSVPSWHAAARIGALVGALAGVALGWQVGARFVMPTPLSRSEWHVVSPGLDENIQDPALGRGVYIEDGALVLRQHAFHRAEILSPKRGTPVARATVEVATGAVRMHVRAGSGNTYAVVGATRAEVPGGPAEGVRVPDHGRWVMTLGEGTVSLETADGPVVLGPGSPATVELTAITEEARVARVEMVATDGSAVLSQDFTGVRPGPVRLVVGALLGAVSGAALGAVAVGAGPVWAVLLLLPVAAVCVLDSATWLFLVERLYLVRTPAWGLARLALGLSLLPLWGGAAGASGWLTPPATDRGDLHPAVWPLVVGVTALVGLLHGPHSAWGLVCALVAASVLWLPARVAAAGGLDRRHALLADLPALASVWLLGFSGLVVGMGWRLVSLSGAASGGRLRRAARPVTDLLFVSLLALPILAEGGLRGSYLERAWDAARLSGDLAPSVGWQNPQPFWTGDCGEGPARRILWMGGSSMGGAYQFRAEPDAFFAAQTHARLCGGLPDGMRLLSDNYGDGGRDSFTVSRSLGDIAARTGMALVVLYVGVNDVLTQSGTKTRAQREAAQAERDAAMRGLAGLGARSRLLTGLSLAVRPLHETDGQRVPEVPLSDAEDNHRRIAETAQEHGARVLFLTELTQGEATAQLDRYRAMQARVAAEYPHATAVDLRPRLSRWSDREMLVDQNHLSREGGVVVAAALAPVVAELLDLPATPATTP